MLLQLRRLPPLRGIYGPQQNLMPRRALLLAPDAATSLLQLEEATGGLVYSDIWRSAEASLAARQAGKGAQRPGYSGHNYGLSVDIAIGDTCRTRAWDYAQLIQRMAAAGWFCHRRDGLRGAEDWHFNFLGDLVGEALALATVGDRLTWARPVERAITKRHGAAFALDVPAQQSALARLGLYRGEVDGIAGPLTRAAREAFERAWMLNGTDVQYQRTLAFVSAEIREV